MCGKDFGLLILTVTDRRYNNPSRICRAPKVLPPPRSMSIQFSPCSRAIGFVKDSSVARDSSGKGLGGIVDERWRRERAERPSDGTPKGGTHVLAVCATPGQLDYFVALALQQHGEQSALRKGRG
jgi:hypothetical protein